MAITDAAVGLTTQRVLLVEDDDGDARLVREALRGGAQRFDLVRATSVEQACTRLATETVDVILLDLGLPDSMGMQTVQRVQAHAGGAALVVLTGLDDDATAERALEAGAQDYLVKGRVDEWTLPRSIRYAIERQRILTDLHRFIAEKDAAHEALEQSEARYRSVSAAAADALVVADERGNVVDWNDAAVQMFGHTEASALALGLGDLVADGSRSELAAILRPGVEAPANDERRPSAVELSAQQADGSTFPTEWAVSTWRINGAQFTSAVIRDISERKAAEQTLREESERLAGVVRAQHEIAKEGFDRDQVLHETARWAATLTGAAGAALLMTDDGGLRCEASFGTGIPAIGTSATKGDDLAGMALAHWQTGLAAAASPLAVTESWHDDRSCVTVLVPAEARLAGVLLVAGEPDDAFDDARRSALELVAAFCGTALDHLDQYVAKRALLEERTTALAAVADREERFRQAFDHAPTGIAMVSLASGDLGRLLRVNTTLCGMAARSADELTDDAVLSDLVTSEDHEVLRGALEELAGAGAGNRELLLRLSAGDGTTRWAEATAAAVADSEGVPIYAIVQMTDVTARREAEHQLRRLALHDPLTGLANRALLLDRLQEALHRAARSAEAVGVLFIDLDRFKTINDTMGHRTGDELLVAVAERISSVLRPADTAARIGGDEFVMICEGAGSDAQLLEIAERIRAAVCQPFAVEAGVVRVEASIGVCLSEPGDAPESLLSRSDTALYRAKDAGRNRCEVLRRDEQGDKLSRNEIAKGLRDAIEAGQLRLHYQPIHELAAGRVAGAETLLRWEHPEHGLLSPGVFLQVAEETGVIVDVGRWVLHEACREAASWPLVKGVAPAVWVNLSGRQAAGHSVADLVEGALAASGLAPDRLYLELTETVLFQASDDTLADFRYLVNNGVQLGIDDFGTGYASMSYLANLPVTFLKVDRSFVDGAPHRSEDAAIVDAVVGLGRALDLGVIAEGIETADQLDWIGAAGCDFAQGYYLGRPAPSVELPFLSAARQRGSP